MIFVLSMDPKQCGGTNIPALHAHAQSHFPNVLKKLPLPIGQQTMKACFSGNKAAKEATQSPADESLSSETFAAVLATCF